ncbi:MAG: hypothetical protein WAW00_01000 [Candidatus Moraniibacteriota bacterium]
MASSFFSGKQASEQKAKKETPSALAVVRTMQDDLNDIKSGTQGGQDPVADERKQPLSPVFKKEPSGAALNPFSEKGEQQLPAMAGSSPFGIVGRANRPVADFSQRPQLDNGLTSMVPEGALTINEPKKSRKWLIAGILSVIIILFVSGGAWYFFSDTLRGLWETAPVPEAAEQSDVTPEIPAPKPLPFSLDTPNYLPINTEVVSPEDIRKTFSQAADRIRTAGIASPVEFLVTDQNNNPLAFSRFAFLLGLDLDPELLALIDETFALYAYDDAGRARLGLVLTLTDTPAAATAITKTETGLPYALQPLILETELAVSRSLVFRTSAYDRFSVRFANIDSIRAVSLDYVLDENRWYVGTSKDTLRAMLDTGAKRTDEAPQSPRNGAL